LLLADAKIFDERARVDARLQALQKFPRALLLQAMIDAAQTAGFCPRRENIFCGRQVPE